MLGSIKKDVGGMGGAAGAIILVLLVVVFFLAATVAMPFATKQGIAAGDTFQYKMESSIEGIDSTLLVMVTAVSASSLNYSYVMFGDDYVDTDSDSAAISYSGNVLNVDFSIGYPLFIERSDLEDMGVGNHTYWFAFIGMTPVLVEKYTMSVDDYTLTIMLKAGTDLVVFIEETGEGEWIRISLVDASMLWVKVF